MTHLELLTAITIAAASSGAILSQYSELETYAHDYNQTVMQRHQYHLNQYNKGFRSNGHADQ